jgi:predicted HNH restriction endonuclease
MEVGIVAKWHEDIKDALGELGGVASLEDIYKQVRKIRSEPHPDTFDAIIRRELESRSSDSKSYLGKEDCFASVDGIGAGVWGLRDSIHDQPNNELAVDIEDGLPARVEVTVSRIIRNTKITRALKLLHQNECQICGLTLLINDSGYSEAHHIKPLGGEHRGPDSPTNILIVCPNCHVELDFSSKKISRDLLREHPKHSIDEQFIEYHNGLCKKK